MYVSEHPHWRFFTTTLPSMASMDFRSVLSYKAAMYELFSKRDLTPQKVENIIGTVARFYTDSELAGLPK